MKILIDLGHPSFVHLFKNTARHFLEKGDEVLFSARDKDVTYHLLDFYGFSYVKLGKVATTLPGKIFGLFKFNARLFRLVKQFKPDVILSGASPYAAHVSTLLGVPHFLFDDTENKEQVYLYRWCSQYTITPKSFSHKLGKKHFKYNGYHELAYLHPKSTTFVLEDDSKERKPLFLLRFISHNASHDTFIDGLSTKSKRELVSALVKIGEVVISHEMPQEADLEEFAYRGAVHEIHNLIAQASMVLGESATMCAEAAMLGVPSILFDPNGRCYIRELSQKYGIVNTYGTEEQDVRRAINSLNNILIETPTRLAGARSKLLKENIHLSGFMIWMLENIPAFQNMTQDKLDEKLKDFLYD